MTVSESHNRKSSPGLLHALEAAILFGTLGGLADASYVISRQPSLAGNLMSAIHFSNAAAVLTVLAFVPCLLVVLVAIRILSWAFKWKLEVGLTALYFMAALPAAVLTSWNVAEQCASGGGSAQQTESIYYFLKYGWLMIPACWALGWWLARIRIGLGYPQIVGRFTAFAASFTGFLLGVPILRARFASGPGSGTEDLESLILTLGVLVGAVIAFVIVLYVSTALAKVARGSILAALWIVAIVGPFVPPAMQGPATTGSRSSGAELSGRGANVILVSIDTLRKDDVGVYGSKITQTPSIDAVAESSLVFDNAVTAIPMTGPSHMTMLTGLQPEGGVGHGVLSNGVLLPQDIPTLATVLDAAGYSTGAVIGGSPLSREASGLQRGFHYYNDVFGGGFLTRLFPSYTWSLTVSRVYRKLRSVSGTDPGWVKKPADEVTDEALSWLEQNSREPFFLFVHYYDPHGPFNPPPPFDTMYSPDVTVPVSQFRDQHPLLSRRISQDSMFSDEVLAKRRAIYRGEVSFADRELGRLIQFLDSNGLGENTLLIITADHGESFDPNYIGHLNRLYESIVTVPLIIRPPTGLSGIDGEVRVGDLVNLSDIFFTALAFLEVDPPVAVDVVHGGVQGATAGWDHNLLGLAGEGPVEAPGGWSHVAMLTHGFPTSREIGVGRIYAFRFDNSKLIYAPQANEFLPEYQYFDLLDDPGETVDIFPLTDPSAMPLTDAPGLLATWSTVSQVETSYSMDPRVRAQLEALGYVQH